MRARAAKRLKKLSSGPKMMDGRRMVAAGNAARTLASPSAWGALAYLTVFGSLVGFTAYAYCLNELPATIVGTYAYVNPVVAVTLGALFLKEPLSAGVLMGGALIVAAVVITTTRRRRAAAPAVVRTAPEANGQPALAQR